jgi:translation elongation factor EF-G
VLVDGTGSQWLLKDMHRFTSMGASADMLEAVVGDGHNEDVPSSMRPSVLSGFKLASEKGPLCEEPLRGVVFIVHGCQVLSTEEIHATPSAYSTSEVAASAYGPMSGQVMSAMKEACRYCFFRRGFARVSEAMLALEVHCEEVVLGKVYGVLDKRRAQVTDEGLREGTSLFYIHAFLPLESSFELARELRGAASGHVTFQCAFSHWQQCEEDPYAESTMTEEELEEFGDAGPPHNTMRKLIDAIRKRKGLPTEEKVVMVATKQRSMTKMK